MQSSHKNPAAASTGHDQSHSRPQKAMTSVYGQEKGPDQRRRMFGLLGPKKPSLEDQIYDDLNARLQADRARRGEPPAPT